MVASLTTKNDDKDAPVSLRVMPAVSPAGKSPQDEVVSDDEVASDNEVASDDEVASDSVSPDSLPSPDAKPKSSDAKSNGKSKTKGKTKGKTGAKSGNFEEAVAFNPAKGSRGVDTLLRNAYRAQLDMLALAATKANIMISLNGLLMSMLIISGTHLISISGLYVLPIGIFLVTCAVATTFAVFAARPEISRNKFNHADFMRDEARLMVFEDFSDLRESEYIDAMTHLLHDPQRTYKAMLAHIYDLGSTADNKYQHLYYSYTAFMTGTIVTVISLLLLAALKWSGVLVLT